MTTPPSQEFVALQRAVAGRYSLEREVGRGGMGIVFLARDVALDRPVAIKLLPPAMAGSPEVRSRFIREAQTAARLSHPNIVPIYAVEERDDLVFFAMAYVDGESLAQRVRRAGPLLPQAGVRLVQEVAWALAYAHGRGIIHRDVKPDNILIEKGSDRALVTDFGIARVMGQVGITSRHEILGTAHYMSPEQASGDPVDGRSDLYSLGVTAYFSMTGTLPFEGPSRPAILARVLSEPAPKLTARRSDLPPALAEAVDRCLAKDPSQRFATGEELADTVGTSRANVREVPPQVRALIRTASEVDYAVVLLVAGAMVAPGIVRGLWPDDLETLYMLSGMIAVGVGVFPLVLIGGARRVLGAGLGPEDVLAAVEEERNARADEARATSLVSPRRRWRWTAGGIALLALALAWAAFAAPYGGGWGPVVLGVVLGSVILVGVLVMESMERSSRSTMEWRRAFGTGFGLALLRGPLGRWLFRVAAKGLGEGRQNVPPSNEPTEVILGGSVGALFDALPGSMRDRFQSVPKAVEQLESDAARLRERERALAQAMAYLAPDHASGTVAARRDAAAAELAAARAAVQARLAAAVAALESIRIDLLRLQAGVGSVDDLTEDLEKAREINVAVDAELAGREAVRQLTGSSTG